MMRSLFLLSTVFAVTHGNFLTAVRRLSHNTPGGLEAAAQTLCEKANDRVLDIKKAEELKITNCKVSGVKITFSQGKPGKTPAELLAECIGAVTKFRGENSNLIPDIKFFEWAGNFLDSKGFDPLLLNQLNFMSASFFTVTGKDEKELHQLTKFPLIIQAQLRYNEGTLDIKYSRLLDNIGKPHRFEFHKTIFQTPLAGSETNIFNMPTLKFLLPSIAKEAKFEDEYFQLVEYWYLNQGRQTVKDYFEGLIRGLTIKLGPAGAKQLGDFQNDLGSKYSSIRSAIDQATLTTPADSVTFFAAPVQKIV